MEILVIGTDEQAAECRQKFSSGHTVRCLPKADDPSVAWSNADVIFDFDTPRHPTRIQAYTMAPETASVFFDTAIVRLGDLNPANLKCSSFGFCGLRTFVNREILEVVVRSETDLPMLVSLCARLGTTYQVVADQAGMVTPRIICMIINEAYYTLEEGTATKDDIDLAMKLGTSYPWGPFEWAERIGLGSVVMVLSAAGSETGDSRYQVCELLKKVAV